MTRYFNKKALTEIRTRLASVDRRSNELLTAYIQHQFKNEQAREYAHHGFCRRIGTLRRCIKNIFKHIPPRTNRIPSEDRLHDAQINLQSFIANVYGCTDNLAWIWVYERGLSNTLSRRDVGLRKKHTKLRATFKPEFQKYLEGIDEWFEYVTEYRDSLGHRIPLYIPPGAVTPKNKDKYNDLSFRMTTVLGVFFDSHQYELLRAEQQKLLTFLPIMMHSFKEATDDHAFHFQILADFLSVEELGQKMLSELRE